MAITRKDAMHENQQNTNINKYHMFVFDVLNALSFRKRAYYKKVENLGKKRGKAMELNSILFNFQLYRKESSVLHHC